MTFEEQVAELHHMKREATSQGMSELTFDLLALEITRRGNAAGVPFKGQFAEIRRRIASAKPNTSAALG